MRIKNLNLSICKDDKTGEFYFNVDIPVDTKTNNIETVKPDPVIPVEQCIYNYGVTNASNVGLNVRQAPNVNSPVIGGLQTGRRFKIVSKVDNWYQISEPFNGYIDADFTQVSPDITTVSPKLVEFTASYEGFSPTAYQDAGGNWTIGYGFCYYNNKPNFTLSEAQAKTILENKLNEVALQITPLTQGLNLNQNEFDSLVDFAYNLGVDALKNSDLLANIKTCDNNAIITADFTAWDHCDGVVLPGLQKRRENEAILFLTGEYINN